MKVGIIGFARSGKTTIFNALTGAHATVGAFGSRDANVAVLKVPDGRVEKLAEIYKPRKMTHAEFQFVDVAPSESGGEQKAFDEAALSLLKNVEALVHVVRAFKNEDIMHPHGGVDPLRDCRALDEELLISDLLIIEKRIKRLEKERRKEHEYEALVRCRGHIEDGAALRTLELNRQEENDIAGYGFLSLKPIMLLGNYGEDAIGTPDPSGLASFAAGQGLTLVDMCGELELEVGELPEEERPAFREDLGLGEESRERFVHVAYDMLGLMSFITAGEPEVRAWTIRKGTKAVDAAGVIHSDLKRGFIRAEAVSFDDLVAAGSLHKAKEQGHVRIEGKDYIVRDGDVLLIRFNV